jgi:UDP-N-acetylglucosamine 4,6-dehydratase
MSLKARTILITGGTGSFGRLMTKELLKREPKEIRIYSRDEEKQLDMQREFSDPRIKFVIGDVRDYERLLEATENVQLVYHAAALKIVDKCEEHPMEALKTNIMGTWNVKRVAIENRVEKSLLISTDKAVKPVNLYGMTKAIAEKIWINDEFLTQSRFAVVRYGNVIGSRGSVIPYFKRLMREGKPLPVTHSEMTRFLITLQQAINLVFYATENMKGGEIFVPRIPACNIMDLARLMAGNSYAIEIVGIRPGEKIHECLIQEDEFRRVKEIGEYFVIHNYGQHKSGKIVEEFTSQKARRLSQEEIASLLKESGWL